MSQVTDQSVFAAGFFRSIEEFCARRRARAAWRGIVILVIHQSYQSRDLAPDLARNCVGDVDTITVGATLRLSIDAAGLCLAELIETLELVAAERTCDAVACELDWWTLVGRLAALAGRWACRPLKFALVTVFAAYVAGWVERYVLPILRFFSQIPW